MPNSYKVPYLRTALFLFNKFQLLPSFSFHVQRLSKRFGTNNVLDEVSLGHSDGVLGIAGPNGSGKSTLLQCLSGLRRPTSGSIIWQKNDSPITFADLKKYIGYAAPYINLYRELTCAENLDFLLQLRGKKGDRVIIQQALKRTGIKALSEHLFSNISTGQQQRLRLSAALMHDPDVLFLDEPGSNLDEKGRNLIKELTVDFRRSQKLVIIASNIPAELELCDRVYSVEREDFIRT
jgi:ABC-type multidrug transport system ATPase subunit